MLDVHIAAHSHARHNRAKLEQDTLCGCFACEKIFSPCEITEWVTEEQGGDRPATALCPYCGQDAVLGESCGFPLTAPFLRGMNRCWFGGWKKQAKELHLQQYSAILSLRVLMEGLLDYAEGIKPWEKLLALLEEQTETAFGTAAHLLPGWLSVRTPEEVFAEELALIRRVSASGADEAKALIERFFATEPQLTAERIDLLIGRNSRTCPPFLQQLIAPLYGCLIGRVPVGVICGRVVMAQIQWRRHPERDVLEDDYWAEGELLTALSALSQATTPGDAASEAAFRQALLPVMETYARTLIQREQYLLG